jgi:HNH endonuclease
MPAGNRHPFAYPSGAHSRRHRPPFYNKYPKYKPWLRDEFVFTCVYCLSRETWNRNTSFFGVEHFRPKSIHRKGIVDYANLLYACNECNRIKSDKILPQDLHPEFMGWGDDLIINEDGTIAFLTKRGKRIIRWFQLDSPENIEWRRKHYDLFRKAVRCSVSSEFARQQLRDFFGFPKTMPTFSKDSGASQPYSERSNLPEWY